MNDQTQDRAKLVTGLRALADFLEQHPDLRIVSAGASGGYLLGPVEQQLATLRDVHAQLPEPEWRDDYLAYALEQAFPGGVTYVVRAERDKVCTPEVVDGAVVWHPPTFDATPSEATA